jgi:hypothetical protein
LCKVSLGGVKEPNKRNGVVLVLLAFDNDLQRDNAI